MKKSQEGQKNLSELGNSVDEIGRILQNFFKQIEDNNKQMTEIVDVFKQISEKTQVINDIVFQTKLLSFNAAVEAARAGEQGKGFSVVAEEVGSLAKMSGQASQEIAAMLSKSNQIVTEVAEKTGTRFSEILKIGNSRLDIARTNLNSSREIFDEIVTNAGSINNHIQELVQSNQESLNGIQSIFQSVSELESISNKNSKAASKNEVNSRELANQVSELTFVANDLKDRLS